MMTIEQLIEKMQEVKNIISGIDCQTESDEDELIKAINIIDDTILEHKAEQAQKRLDEEKLLRERGLM